MLIKFLVKIWPALIPITIYLLWVFILDKVIKKLLKKSSVIEGEFKIVGEGSANKSQESSPLKISKFSLQNRNFVIVLYLSLILAILALILTALR